MFTKLFHKQPDHAPKHADAGKELLVGDYRVTILEQLAEGGFGAVFLVRDVAGAMFALKKVRAHDPESIQAVLREIAALTELRDNPFVVKLFASSQTQAGRFTEFHMLLEYCHGGHVVDIMNKRLAASKAFEEAEVLKIFSDLCLAVHACHHMSPPIIHRDLKPENVLLSTEQGTFKLCDFGSVTREGFLPGSAGHAIAACEEELQKYTTLQYRAPEMVDLYRRSYVGEKADVWALGCVLFKLCFFQDAFEESALAVLNGKYKIPDAKAARFSPQLLDLIVTLFSNEPDARPTIDDVVEVVFKLRKLPCPITLKSKPRRGSMSAERKSARKPLPSALVNSTLLDDEFEALQTARAPSAAPPTPAPAPAPATPAPAPAPALPFINPFDVAQPAGPPPQPPSFGAFFSPPAALNALTQPPAPAPLHTPIGMHAPSAATVSTPQTARRERPTAAGRTAQRPTDPFATTDAGVAITPFGLLAAPPPPATQRRPPAPPGAGDVFAPAPSPFAFEPPASATETAPVTPLVLPAAATPATPAQAPPPTAPETRRRESDSHDDYGSLTLDPALLDAIVDHAEDGGDGDSDDSDDDDDLSALPLSLASLALTATPSATAPPPRPPPAMQRAHSLPPGPPPPTAAAAAASPAPAAPPSRSLSEGDSPTVAAKKPPPVAARPAGRTLPVTPLTTRPPPPPPAAVPSRPPPPPAQRTPVAREAIAPQPFLPPTWIGEMTSAGAAIQAPGPPGPPGAPPTSSFNPFA